MKLIFIIFEKIKTIFLNLMIYKSPTIKTKNAQFMSLQRWVVKLRLGELIVQNISTNNFAVLQTAKYLSI